MSEKFEEKAIDAYSYDARGNVTENGVIMVTVTLDEYRELVTAKAKSEQRERDLENWKLRQEVDKLKQQILDLTLGNGLTESEQQG